MRGEGQENILLRVATLNTWHGLNGRGKVNFGQLESRIERMARLARQVNCLRALNADVLLLQEVNPLPFRAHWYAEKLGKRCFFASGNTGVKLGWGPPGNLNEGLAILCPPTWDVEFLGKKRLSGRFSLRPFRISEVGGPFLSLQLHESRVATAIRLFLPRSRQIGRFPGQQSVLLASVHLHHSPALTPRAQEVLDKARSTGLSREEEDHLLKCFRLSNGRRVAEVEALCDWLEHQRLPGEPVIVGGDFNAEPGSAPIAGMMRRGWLDAWHMAGNPDDLSASATWDPKRNPLASRAERFLHRGADFSEKTHSVMTQLEMMPRRIDYLFVYPWKSQDDPKSDKEVGGMGNLMSVRRFGYLPHSGLAAEGMSPSDLTDGIALVEKAAHEGTALEEEAHVISDHFGLEAVFGSLE